MAKAIAWMSILVLSPSAFANVGVFTGSGYTIQLSKTADVQLVSEEVTIVPGRGRFLFDGGVGGMDRVEYDCKFVLKNLATRSVTIQVGFPLSSQFLNSPGESEDIDAAEVVFDHKFIARDEEQPYHLRFRPYDKDKQMLSLFLWDMEFKANEVRELRVSYQMPISMALDTTAKQEMEYTKEWYKRLEGAVREYFGYVTETGQSWAGSIETAKFQVYVAGFEKYLESRLAIEGSNVDSEQPDGDGEQAESKPYPTKHFVVRREVRPAGWKEAEGVLTWEFTNYKPKEPIAFSYLMTCIPKTVDGEEWLMSVPLAEKPLNNEDFDDLREVLLAAAGFPVRSEWVKRFVSNQVWYIPKESLHTEDLDADGRKMIGKLDAIQAGMN